MNNQFNARIFATVDDKDHCIMEQNFKNMQECTAWFNDALSARLYQDMPFDDFFSYIDDKKSVCLYVVNRNMGACGLQYRDTNQMVLSSWSWSAGGDFPFV